MIVNPDWKDERSDPSDLQNELHQVTSQLKAIQSDYDSNDKAANTETDQSKPQS